MLKPEGVKWTDPDNFNNSVRIDKGNLNSKFTSQKVDHVVVNSNGKVLGRNGAPINGGIRENAIEAHIPLSEYVNWKKWNSKN
jgi:filamentous hemagglutinin